MVCCLKNKPSTWVLVLDKRSRISVLQTSASLSKLINLTRMSSLSGKSTASYSDMTTLASSPEYSFETGESCMYKLKIDLDIQPRKLNRKQVAVNQERALKLRKEIKEMSLDNAKLKAENAHLRTEIQFCREVFASNKIPSTPKSNSGMLFFSALAVIGCVLTTTETTLGKGESRRLVMTDDNSKWWGPAAWVVLVSLAWYMWRRTTSKH